LVKSFTRNNNTPSRITTSPKVVHSICTILIYKLNKCCELLPFKLKKKLEFINISKILDPSTDISHTNEYWNDLIQNHMTPIYHNIFNINESMCFNAMKFVVKIHDYMISTLNFTYQEGNWNICKILSTPILESPLYNCSSLTTLILLICNKFDLFRDVLAVGFMETHMFIISHNKKWIFETTRSSKWRPVDYIYKNCGSFMTTDTICGLLANYGYSGLFRITKTYKQAKYILLNYPLKCPDHLFLCMLLNKNLDIKSYKVLLLKLIKFIKDNQLITGYILMICKLLHLATLKSAIDYDYHLIIKDLKGIIEQSYVQYPNHRNVGLAYNHYSKVDG
jgi:hypothetical protein